MFIFLELALDCFIQRTLKISLMAAGIIRYKLLNLHEILQLLKTKTGFTPDEKQNKASQITVENKTVEI